VAALESTPGDGAVRQKKKGILGAKPRFLGGCKNSKAEALAYLDVVCQEVVVIESCSADGGCWLKLAWGLCQLYW